MRRSPFLMLAAVVALACADTPSSPLLEPQMPSFDKGGAPAPAPDYPPPPFAIIEGGGTTAENIAFTYIANFFVNKPGNVAWVMFTGGSATFSNNARIVSVNGNVSGFGTMTVGGTTYQLNTVNEFGFNGNCTVTRGSCASFSGSGFSSSGSIW